LIGKTVAHYEITGLLGKGGMGEVYRARDTKLQRDVAFKVLPTEMSGDPERTARFEREARTLASLQHPNVASIYGFEEVDGIRFLTMELVEGEDLAEHLTRGSMPIEEALHIARQVAIGLEAAHEKNIVHRDLKPANIKLGEGGVVKILDFGLARAYTGDSPDAEDLALSPTITTAMTQAGVVLGTAAYMSPEQARGKTVDKRADIWAYGVVLYELLAGRQLFEGESVSDVLAGVLKTEPALHQLPRDTPRSITKLLERCLDKNPLSRLRDIGEARIAIDRALGGEVEETSSVSAAATPRSSANRTVWIVALILVAAMASVTTWLLTPDAPEPPLRRFRLPAELTDASLPDGLVISRDGSKIAYTNAGRLYVRELDELAPREISTPGIAAEPCWSPDGAYIGYVSGSAIWRVPSTGGASAKICEPATGFTAGTGLAWSLDNRIIYSQGSGPVFEVSANGGDSRILVPLLEDEEDTHTPSVLPDRKGVLFISHRDGDAPDRVEVAADGARKLVFRIPEIRIYRPRYASSGHIVYRRTGTNSGVWAVPFSLSSLEVTGEPFLVTSDGSNASISDDGTLVFLRGVTDRRNEFVWVDRNGALSDPVTQGARWFFAANLSPDGKRLAVSEWDGSHTDIWIHDLERKTRTRFTFGDHTDIVTSWSADGKRLWYYDTTTDSMMTRSVDGTGSPIAIAEGHGPSVSSDGKYIVYYRSTETAEPDLWYLELDGKAKPRPLVTTPAAERFARISHDGNYVVYVSDESGADEIYITRFPTGEGKWQVSTAGGIFPMWGRDDKSLYYQDTLQNLMEVRLQLDPSPSLEMPTTVVDPGQLGLSSGFGREYAVDIDGSRFLWHKTEADQGDQQNRGIIIVENWAREFGGQ
jgi:Tol biopolymer transport system component/tRNA A-37 threonylcarbamoyl transferase component Bud32